MAKNTDDYDFTDFLISPPSGAAEFNRQATVYLAVSNLDKGGALRLCFFKCIEYSSICQAIRLVRKSGATSECYMYHDDNYLTYIPSTSPADNGYKKCSIEAFASVSSFYECASKCMTNRKSYMVFGTTGPQCQCADKCDYIQSDPPFI